MQASLYQVKKAEKEREGFKKKMSWPLRQLKLFDAKYFNKVNRICLSLSMFPLIINLVFLCCFICTIIFKDHFLCQFMHDYY